MFILNTGRAWLGSGSDIKLQALVTTLIDGLFFLGNFVCQFSTKISGLNTGETFRIVLVLAASFLDEN